MQVLANIVNYILDMGAAVFLPIIMIILGLIVGLSPKKAISAGLLLGVAFTGMNLVIGYMSGAISPAAQALVENTGKQLTTIDMGWTPISAVTWAWPYAFLVFPIQIAVNLIMMAFGWTKCLNVDMWNVWAKVFCCVIMLDASGSMVFAFVVCVIMIVIELKMADTSQKQIEEITHIPGVCFPHAMSITGVVIAPLNAIIEAIPGVNKININADKLREKLGIFGENHILGFILGVIIGILGKYSFANVLILGIESATSLLLFPMIAKLFMQALAPIADAAAEFMKKKFPGREFYIGLDWPFLAGSSELWVTMILLVPFILLISLFLPGNTTLPFGGILMVCFAPVALYVCRANVFKMFITGLLTMPLYLWVGSYFAPAVTELAKAAGTLELPADQLVTWNGMFCPEFYYAFAQVGHLFKGDGNPIGLIATVAFIVLLFWYFRHMSKREKEAAERLANR